jgi:hypothetical protein
MNVRKAIQMKTPVRRYRLSRIAYPERLPEVIYPDGDRVLMVGWDGKVKLDGYRFRVSNALRTHRIAARAVEERDGVYDLFFVQQRIGQMDLCNLTKKN